MCTLLTEITEAGGALNILTFPEDWMPLIIAKQTMTQEASKQMVIFQFKPPLSEMELEIFSASLYQ